MAKYKNFSDEEIEDLKEELNEMSEGYEIPEEIDDYEKASEEMLASIKKLAVGEEKSRAIDDLKTMQEISCNRKKLNDERRLKYKKAQEEMNLKLESQKQELELKKETLEQELKIKEAELAIREEELKNQKRSGILGFLGPIIATGLSFFGYNYLLTRQNEFESHDSYSSSGSRGLNNNISHFGNIGRR